MWIQRQAQSADRSGFPIRSRNELPTPCRLKVGSTAGWKPALRGFDQDDGLDCPLQHNKRFLKRIPQSREQAQRGPFTRLEGLPDG